MSEFAASYNQYFAIVRAGIPELLDRAYRLRYQVYCIENPYEDPARCRDEREIDDDDDRSVHTLLIHRRSGMAAGTARVIMLPLDTERPLPMQRLLGPRECRAIGRLPPYHTGEISRFAVSKEFRRRVGEER
jgi:N-acyl amino acid synthase of PEP-CTERM/exosortase system